MKQLIKNVTINLMQDATYIPKKKIKFVNGEWKAEFDHKLFLRKIIVTRKNCIEWPTFLYELQNDINLVEAQLNLWYKRFLLFIFSGTDVDDIHF